ncbi:MAG: DUF3793 family protein [Selenomonadaceae bacterium]
MGASEFEAVLAEHCAPTFRGLKAASLISLPVDGRGELGRLIIRYAPCLACHGVSVRRIGIASSRALILFYRADILARLLMRPMAQSILRRYGYPVARSLDEATVLLSFQIEHLAERIGDGDTFPHEIGLFLGYPPSDVVGFIRHHGHDYLDCGFWKVYSNKAAAKKLFGFYRKCTDHFVSCLAAGKQLPEILDNPFF